MVGTTEGAARVVPLMAGLRDHGYEMLAIVSGPRGGLIDRLDAAGIPHRSTPLSLGAPVARLRRLGYPLDVLYLCFAVLRLAWILRRERIDLVHSRLFNSNLIGRLAAWTARVPVRISQVVGCFHLEAPLTRTLDRATVWMDTCVIGACDEIVAIYRGLGVPARRLRRVYSTANADRFDPARADPAAVRAELRIAAEAPLVGHVAYIYPPTDGPLSPAACRGRGVKAQDDFIEAARMVLDHRPDAMFLVVGSGWGEAGERYLRELEARARRLGLARALIFTGGRDDVPDVLAALDVSVQCSLSEALGGTLESLLMEVPTVATRVGGMPEAVRHRETGLLVPPSSPPQLAAAILEMLAEPRRAREMARAGRRWALENCTEAHAVAATERIYRELGAVPA